MRKIFLLKKGHVEYNHKNKKCMQNYFEIEKITINISISFSFRISTYQR